jgi:hypothetical protein
MDGLGIRHKYILTPETRLCRFHIISHFELKLFWTNDIRRQKTLNHESDMRRNRRIIPVRPLKHAHEKSHLVYRA